MSDGLTLIKEDDCNMVNILVPMNGVKAMFGDQIDESNSLFEPTDDPNTVLEIGCEIKSVNKILGGPTY